MEGCNVVDKTNQSWTQDGFVIRSLVLDDIDMYYDLNFNPLDFEVARMTGGPSSFDRQTVSSYLVNCIHATDRYDFVIVNPKGNIIGEVVINEIDNEVLSANFRIAIFQRGAHGQGIEQWATEVIQDFAFRELKLNRLELEVFAFNTKGLHVYKKSGFIQEGVLREAHIDNGAYTDIILMSILRSDWLKRRSNQS